MVILLLMFQLWNSYGSPQTRLDGDLLLGMWQSCLGPEGYEERAFDEVVNGKFLWSFHMGPQDEFALYKGKGPEDGADHLHAHPANLLGDSFHYNAIRSRSGRNWTIPSLGLRINVVASGGSRSECESYAVKISKLKVR